MTVDNIQHYMSDMKLHVVTVNVHLLTFTNDSATTTKYKNSWEKIQKNCVLKG